MTFERRLKLFPFLSECSAYPDSIESEQDKVLFALQYSGEQPYHKLLLFTGLDTHSLNNGIKSLVDRNLIKATKLGDNSDCFDNAYVSSAFRIK